MRPNGFRVVRRTQRWIHPDDDLLAQPPAAAPFDPAPFAGAYEFDSPGVRAGWWFHPPDDATGLIPEAAPEFDPAPFAGAYAFEPTVLYAGWPPHPDDDWLGRVPEAPFDPAPFAGAYQPDLSIIPTAVWAVPPEHPWEGLEPPPEPPFDPAQGGMWEEQPGQERSLAIRWYQPEDAFEGLEPPFVPSAPELEQSVAAGIEGTIGDNLVARTHVWYQNDWHAPILPYDPAKQGPHSTPDLSLQDRWNWPVWYQPEDATEGLEPPAEAPFDPAPYAGAYQGDLHDAWRPARWFVPDDDWLGQVQVEVPFDPAPFAGAYQEQRSDRFIQPTWYQSEDDWLGQPPAEAPFDPAPFAGSYQEQREDRWAQPWRHPDDDWTALVPPLDPAPFAGLFGLDQVGVPLIWQPVIETEAGPLVNPEAQRAGLWVDELPLRQSGWWHPLLDGADPQFATLGVITPQLVAVFGPRGIVPSPAPLGSVAAPAATGSASSEGPDGEAPSPAPLGNANSPAPR